MAWTHRNRIIVALIIGAIIGVFCTFFFNNILWLPLMIMVTGLVSLFCKPAADVPAKDEAKFFDQ